MFAKQLAGGTRPGRGRDRGHHGDGPHGPVGLGRQSPCAMAISAADIASWDLCGRSCWASRSLGRSTTRSPPTAAAGFTSYTDTELAEQLRGWVERGCGAVKVKAGRDLALLRPASCHFPWAA